jgi:hypothetical protein
MRDLDFPNALLPYPKGQTHGRIEKDTDRIRSPAHMSWLHTLTCSVPSCRQGPIHAHHLTCGPEGKSQSAGHTIKAPKGSTLGATRERGGPPTTATQSP